MTVRNESSSPPEDDPSAGVADEEAGSDQFEVKDVNWLAESSQRLPDVSEQVETMEQGNCICSICHNNVLYIAYVGIAQL